MLPFYVESLNNNKKKTATNTDTENKQNIIQLNKKQIHIQKLKQNTEIVKTKIENRENRKHTDFLSKPSPHT